MLTQPKEQGTRSWRAGVEVPKLPYAGRRNTVVLRMFALGSAPMVEEDNTEIRESDMRKEGLHG
jgi:hypothetical protein